MSPKKTAVVTMITACAFTLTLALGTLQDPPAGHPPTGTPQVPTGHPDAGSTAKKPAVKRRPANPEDVATIDAIVDAYYDSVSGGKGEARDWERFLSLFMYEGRFVTSRPKDGQILPVAITPADFIQMNRGYFESGGYYEQDIHRITKTYGNIAQVFSTYASRRKLEDPKPYSRGINSMQLMKVSGRWWIISVMWDYENGQADHVIPAEFLPDTTPEDG